MAERCYDMVRYGILIAGLTGIVCAGCASPETNVMKIAVSIPPQKYFVERISGGRVEVMVMVEPGRNPHTYDPLPRQMLELSRARVYFSIGVPFERAWMSKIQAVNPKMMVVDTRRGITLQPMDTIEDVLEGAAEEESGGGHDHVSGGRDDAHAHDEGMDPHIWLSPELVKIQARTICETLCGIDRDNERVYRENLTAFERDLNLLSDEITQAFASVVTRKMMVFHPAWGYFADQFGLRQIPVEIRGKEPSPARLAAIIEYARSENIRVVFVQSQFSTRSAEAVAREIGGTVITVDPLAEQYIDNLRTIALTISRNLQ